MKKTDEDLKPNNENGEVRLSVPWIEGDANICNVAWGSEDVTRSFVEDRTRLHETYIREQEKTKRLALILSSVLFICALAIVMFAPEGREELSYWIGGTLLLFSSGAAGYKRLWAKGPLLSFEAGEEEKK